MKRKEKVIIFVHLIQYYRAVIYNLIAKNYDVAIGLMNLRCFDIITLPFNPFIKKENK
ncbi:hypothetical protein [Tenacibaculum singaporense]|uniref:hypothetical protein n=1 Tax=Tenacibaculum singaporense TaxID=2358479 RepID=UPI00142D62CE|nr:hypothetical protein [Tenacibaculum singaporense]